MGGRARPGSTWRAKHAEGRRRAAAGFLPAHPRASPGATLGFNKKAFYAYYPHHLNEGLQLTHLGMNYDSTLSLVLSNDCVISKFKFIEGEAVDTTDDEDPIAHQDADFVLMTGTLKRILQDLTKQLGGYAPVSH